MYNLFCFFILIFSNCCFGINLEIRIKDGIVRGTEEYDWKGRKFYSFKGIPYAKPPVGQLRFQPPEPNHPWKGVLEAYDFGASCPQGNREKLESEDCLYINVFVPERVTKFKKAVMLNIHGGGWVENSGTSKQIGIKNIIAEDIIAVTFNYRLGLLGFLKINDPAIRVFGNMGLKDQVLALKWVKDNIIFFGGNPNQITLVGNSDGGTSAHAHMLSPMSKGLFHRVICESGVLFYNDENKNYYKYAKRLNEKLGYKLINDFDAFKIFNSSTGQQLYDSINANETLLGYGAVTLVTEHSSSPKPFINIPTDDLVESNLYATDVPMIIGYNSEESLNNYLLYNQTSKDKWINISNYTLASYLKKNKDVFKNTDLENYKKLIVDYYTSLKFSDVYNFLHLQMDINFFLPNYFVMKSRLNSKLDNFLYRFNLNSTLNYVKRRDNLLWLEGASHADELGYIYRQDVYPEVKNGSLEEKEITILTTLWANFIKTGNPNYPEQILSPKWLPTNRGHLSILHMTNEKFTSDTEFIEKDRLTFWEKLRKAHSNKNIETKYHNLKANKPAVPSSTLLLFLFVLIGLIIFAIVMIKLSFKNNGYELIIGDIYDK